MKEHMQYSLVPRACLSKLWPLHAMRTMNVLMANTAWQVLLFFTASATYMRFAMWCLSLCFLFSLCTCSIFFIFFSYSFFLFPSCFHPFLFPFLFPYLLYLFIYNFVFILFPDYEPHIHNLIYNLFFYNLY